MKDMIIEIIQKRKNAYLIYSVGGNTENVVSCQCKNVHTQEKKMFAFVVTKEINNYKDFRDILYGMLSIRFINVGLSVSALENNETSAHGPVFRD